MYNVSNDKTTDLLPDEKSNIVIEDDEEKKNNDEIIIKNLKYKTPITYIKHIENLQNDYLQLYKQHYNREPNKDTSKIFKSVKKNKELNELDEKYSYIKIKIDELKEKNSNQIKK